MKLQVIFLTLATMIGCAASNKVTVYPDGAFNKETAITFDSIEEYKTWQAEEALKERERVLNENIDFEGVTHAILEKKFPASSTVDSYKYFVSILGIDPSEKLLFKANESFGIYRPGSAWEIGEGMSVSFWGFKPVGREILVTVSTYCGPLCASQTDFYLENIEGKWLILREELKWIS